MRALEAWDKMVAAYRKMNGGGAAELAEYVDAAVLCGMRWGFENAVAVGGGR